MTALAERIRALPMSEPPSAPTIASARELASELTAMAGRFEGEGARLASACARALEGGADRELLLVHAVPLVVAAVLLLGCEHRGPEWERGLAGARYEIETLLPGPIRPDVAVSSLRRKVR